MKKIIKEPMRDAFKNHFEQQQLDTDKLEKLNQLTKPFKEPPIQHSLPIYRIMLLVLASVASLWLYQTSNYVEHNLPEAIAAEVTKNHLKMRPLEVETNSMNQIRQYFTELDFMPAHSKQFAMNDQQLLGGRYCSIQGITAAQLRYLDSENRLSTLYETQYDPRVFSDIPNIDKGEEPLTLFSRGLLVDMWVEKDLLMVNVHYIEP
jgi:hypothetical protein